MKKTKQLAWLMICILIVQIIPGNLFANSQNIVSRPDITKPISHKKDSNDPDKISPTVEMAWAKPEPTPGLVNLEPGNPMKDTHYTTDYQMELYDYGSGKTRLSQYIKDNKESLLADTQVKSSFVKQSENEFIVNLRVIENQSNLIDLNLNVSSEKQAKQICNNWNNNASNMYAEVINLLIRDIH